MAMHSSPTCRRTHTHTSFSMFAHHQETLSLSQHHLAPNSPVCSSKTQHPCSWLLCWRRWKWGSSSRNAQFNAHELSVKNKDWYQILFDLTNTRDLQICILYAFTGNFSLTFSVISDFKFSGEKSTQKCRTDKKAILHNQTNEVGTFKKYVSVCMFMYLHTTGKHAI